jgi:hypothetical protein
MHVRRHVGGPRAHQKAQVMSAVERRHALSEACGTEGRERQVLADVACTGGTPVRPGGSLMHAWQIGRNSSSTPGA